MGIASLVAAAANRSLFRRAATPVLGGRLPGIALSMAIALISIGCGQAPWLQSHGLGALVIAMVLGMAIGNLFPSLLSARYAPGIAFSKQTLLRAGIVLYGTRVTFADIGMVGWSGIAIDACTLLSTFALALFFGKAVLKLERNTVLLIGAGSSICGAAAVLATEPVVEARAEQVTVAVATVVIFGTLATFLYPFLYRLNLEWQMLPPSAASFGIYAGSTIHEVAQVVAAARLAHADSVNAAVIAKMVRVMLLPAFLLALSAGLRGRGRAACARRLAVPWFAFAFIGVVLLNSLLPLPAALAARVEEFDTLLLAMAMAALGMGTRLSAFRQAGAKPVLLAGMLFVWLVIGGGVINRVVPLWMGPHD